MKSKLKAWVQKLDSHTSYPVYTLSQNIYHQYLKGYNKYCSLSTPFYRLISPIKAKIVEKQNENIRLHVGCGKKRKADFVNIDINKTPATDLVLNATKLPFSDRSVAKIETYHMIEHIPRQEVKKMLDEWHRVLKKEGELVIECPDLRGNMENYLNDKNPELSLYYIFGRQRFPGDTHHWGYDSERLSQLLKDAGFKKTKEAEPQDYHKKEAPCIRIEAVK